MKRIMTIQDISCIGKCSLTVALPIISAMGIETAIVPTALLSTHTAFSEFTFKDLTSEMRPIKDHWKKENFKFDAIYTGYLGSKEQIKIVGEYIDSFKGPNTIVIVDPAMADNGKLYAGFDMDFVREMEKLCQRADFILPNISEACLLMDEEYPGEEADEETIHKLLIKLTAHDMRFPIITGTAFADGTFGFTGVDSVNGEIFRYGTKKIPHKSHGTGDIFASTFTGALMNEYSYLDALKIASKYTCACIENTYNDPERVNYAVNFEAEIPYLLKLINKY